MSEKKRVDAVFECGAVIENVQSMRHDDGVRTRKTDGRASCVVYDSDTERPGTKMRRPLMPDGTIAPCRFGCPAKRASGRKEQRYWPDETNSAAARKPFENREGGRSVTHFPVYITCFPAERERVK